MMNARRADLVVCVITAVGFVVATAVLDLLLFRWLDVVATATLRHVSPSLGPLWLSLPRLIVFSAIGVAFYRWSRRPLALAATTYIFLLLVYFAFVRFGGGIWVADDWFSWLLTYAPLAAAPVGFLLGLGLGSRLRGRAKVRVGPRIA